MVPKEEKERWHYIVVKRLSALLHGQLQNIRVIFIAWIVSILLEQKVNLNLVKMYVKLKISVEL